MSNCLSVLTCALNPSIALQGIYIKLEIIYKSDLSTKKSLTENLISYEKNKLQQHKYFEMNSQKIDKSMNLSPLQCQI